MVMLMMWSVWPLLIESALILLQTVPTHIDIEKLKRKLLENIDGILAVSTIRNIENVITVYILENTELEPIYIKIKYVLGTRISRLAASWRSHHSISTHKMPKSVGIYEGISPAFIITKTKPQK